MPIGERRKPAPNGTPGYLRLDTVHQGDGPDGKGLYHINAVDEFTQWEIVLAVPRISEAYLLPVLRQILSQFPFRIRGFHTDNVLTREGVAEEKTRFLSIPYGVCLKTTVPPFQEPQALSGPSLENSVRTVQPARLQRLQRR